MPKYCLRKRETMSSSCLSEKQGSRGVLGSSQRVLGDKVGLPVCGVQIGKGGDMRSGRGAQDQPFACAESLGEGLGLPLSQRSDRGACRSGGQSARRPGAPRERATR